MTPYRTPGERAELSPAQVSFALSWLLDGVLANWRWYRWLRGGHWELRYVKPPVSSAMWVQTECSEYHLGSTGPYACEDYR